MPLYTYRREDGSTFDVRQSFADAALTVDPQTGQPVVRVVQAAGIIFKGSGFYINDSKSASKSNISTPPRKTDGDSSPASGDSASKSEAPASESKSTADSKSEGGSKPPGGSKSEGSSKPAAESKPAVSSAAD